MSQFGTAELCDQLFGGAKVVGEVPGAGWFMLRHA